MRIKLFIIFSFAFLAFVPARAFAESISSFKELVTINPDSSIAVVEDITYDFGAVAHHGIFRNIPYSYDRGGGKYNLQIKALSVTDGTGIPYKYSTSKTGGNFQIKIGDANTNLTGVREYILHYTVQGAINYFSDHDELYWNATGNDWTVPISNVQIQVAGLEQFGSAVTIACYSGAYGASVPCTQSANTAGVPSFFEPQLMPGQGLTFVTGFPKGFVHQPTNWEKIFQMVRDNVIVLLPIAVFLFMWFLWRKKGKDPLGFSTIVPQYEAPESLTPTEVGAIVDASVDTQDVTAEIIHLAVLGFIKITRLETKKLIFTSTDYQLDLLKPTKDMPERFQQRISEGLFNGSSFDEHLGLQKSSVKISDLKNSFYEDLKAVKDMLYDSVVEKGYFAANPQKVRGGYTVTSAILIIGGIWLGKYLGLYPVLSIIVSAIIIGVFGYFMPALTVKGAQTKQQILGLKLYLSVAEKDRLKFFNAPEKTPERFEKLLPYAIVLGVENEWAAQFESLYTQPPTWYNDPYSHGFNSLLLMHSLNEFSSSTNTVVASHPSRAGSGGSGFGGGGFSGGGFGGGGGGSW